MTMLTGSGAPFGGSDGDMWLDTATLRLYGPRAAGTWPTTYEVLGGAYLLSGAVPPTTEGTDGDFYLDTAQDRLWGPKAAGAWTSYIGLGATTTYVSSKDLTQRIMFRRDTAANWLSENPVLAQGEPGFETDTLKYKIGTGLDADTWDQLPYQGVLPAGGLTGQVPVKASDLDGDWTWLTPVISGTVTNAAALTASQLVIGAGGAAVAKLGSLGTVQTVLHGNAAGAPSFASVNLTTTVTGILPVANGGTGLSTAAVKALVLTVGDETTAITAGTGKLTFRMPYAMTLTSIKASLSTAQTGSGGGGIFTVDVNDSGTTVLSTKVTIDNGEKTSATAATPSVLSDTALAADAEITVDVDQIGDGTAKGLKVTLLGT